MISFDFICGFLVCIVLILLWKNGGLENYVNKKEKADTILSWFKDGGDSYAKYKKEVPDSDVVEYNETRELNDKGRLNKTSIMNVIA
jgi:hypothetical protein